MRKIFFALAIFFALSTAVFAEGVGLIDAAKNAGFEVECPEGVANCSDETKYETADAQNFVLRLIGGLLNFVAVVAVVMLVVAAIRLVTALGNQENLQAAKKQLIWTFAGLAIIIVALLIVQNITEKIYEVAEIDEPVVAEEEKECLELVVDGKHGPETEKARNEVSRLAAEEFGVDNSTHSAWENDKIISDKVTAFQLKYNSLECDKKTGKKIDPGSGGSSSSSSGGSEEEGSCDGESPCDGATCSEGGKWDTEKCDREVESVCGTGDAVCSENQTKNCSDSEIKGAGYSGDAECNSYCNGWDARSCVEEEAITTTDAELMVLIQSKVKTGIDVTSASYLGKAGDSLHKISYTCKYKHYSSHSGTTMAGTLESAAIIAGKGCDARFGHLISN